MAKWSNFNYAFNNPIKFIDPDGKAPESGGNPGYAHQQVKRRIENVAKNISSTLTNIGNSITSFFGGSSTAASVTETLTDSKTDTPNFNGKSGLNTMTKVLGPVMTGISMADSYENMDPENPESVKEFENKATVDAFGLIPVIGPGLSQVVENSMDPEGTFNLDNGKMKAGYSSGHDTAKSMTDARERSRDQDAAKRESNYTEEQKRKMNLRSSNNGYQRALRGG